MEQSNPWFLVMTKPQMESVAYENLARQGYKLYLPYWSSLKKQRGKWTLAKSPMFPRYMFVCVNNSKQSISPVRSTRGVSHIVKFGLKLATASDALIADIRELEKSSSARSKELTPFQKGEHVQVVKGPFSGVAAEVLACDQQRVILLLKVLGKSQSLEFEINACQSK